MSAASLNRPRGSWIPIVCATAILIGAAQPALAQERNDLARINPASGSPIPAQEPPSNPDAPDGGPKKTGFFDRFIDEEDGQIDFSNFLAKGGFVPVPIFITEPAVDNGFGLAAVFITAPKDRPREVSRRGAAALRTGNGSQAIAYFQSGYGFDGRLNYRFGIAHGKVTLDAFPSFAPEGIGYTSHYDYGILGSALWRLGETDFSIGPVVDFRKLRTNLNVAGLPEDYANEFNKSLHTGAVGLGVHFDSRDNMLTPTKGTNALVEARFNRSAFGSDRDYELYDAELFSFGRLTSNLRYGFKFKLNAIRGDFPAYYAPSIDLRGVQAVQYQGMNVLSSEFELTWQANRRWSLLAFGGYGTTDAGTSRFYDDSGAIGTVGVGFRYRLARKLGLDVGADFAHGPRGSVFYLQFGHAWVLSMD